MVNFVLALVKSFIESVSESIPGRVTMAMTTLLTLAAMFGAVRLDSSKLTTACKLQFEKVCVVIYEFLPAHKISIRVSLTVLGVGCPLALVKRFKG